MSFFVTSTTGVTGNLDGLTRGRCHVSATGCRGRAGWTTWRAYLSVERDPANGNQPTHARTASAAGPGTTPASGRGERLDRAPLADGRRRIIPRRARSAHQRPVDGSPAPVEHDILTGSNADGTLAAGLTCSDWTSDSATVTAQVGHSDGMGQIRTHNAAEFVLELSAREPELLEHGPARRRRSVLLLRSLEPILKNPSVVQNLNLVPIHIRIGAPGA